MDVIIDAVISLLYAFKYGPMINKRRNFYKKINVYREVNGDDAIEYISYVTNEISRLKVGPYSSGKPFCAVFEKAGDTARVFILNEQLQFMYRLEDYTSVSSSFYIKLSY